MNNLEKLLHECSNMDITAQLKNFDDAFLPSAAAAEYAVLLKEREELRALLKEVVDFVTPLTEWNPELPRISNRIRTTLNGSK